MKTWWWRVALLVIGLSLICCSLCVVAYSYLNIERDVDRERVPIEIPPSEPTPESRWLIWVV